MTTVSLLLALAVPMLWAAYPIPPTVRMQASPISQYPSRSFPFVFVCNLKWLILYSSNLYPSIPESFLFHTIIYRSALPIQMTLPSISSSATVPISLSRLSIDSLRLSPSTRYWPFITVSDAPSRSSVSICSVSASIT